MRSAEMRYYTTTTTIIIIIIITTTIMHVITTIIIITVTISIIVTIIITINRPLHLTALPSLLPKTEHAQTQTVTADRIKVTVTNRNRCTLKKQPVQHRHSDDLLPVSATQSAHEWHHINIATC